tara:strand:- start:86670 stop:87296 length:627 start_codon:yes stop_codon:yes gene_type:complete
MQYIGSSAGSTLVPKLVGCYEQELHEALLESLSSSPPVIIDIGCAEGYYAVGCALKVPASRTLAFDIDPVARRSTSELADLNDVTDRVEIRSCCTIEVLKQAAIPGALVICDCEGGEWELLRPDIATSLSDARIIVELHADDMEEAAREMSQRFDTTHECKRIAVTSRSIDLCGSVLHELSPEDKKIAISEMRRSDQLWLYLTPIQNG